MPSATSDLLILAGIGLVQLLGAMSPGPSFLLTAQTAAAGSRRDGVMVALGLSLGAAAWAFAALFGLNAVFQRLPLAYAAVGLAGGLYLIWIGVRIFRAADRPLAMAGAAGTLSRGPFLRGLVLQLSNPKVVMFFSSIFIAMLPRQTPLWMSLALVGIVFFNDLWWYSLVGAFFGSGPVQRFYAAAKGWLDRIMGLCLAGLGLRLLWLVAVSL